MSAPGIPSPETVQGQPGLSEPQRIIDTFVAPSKTFQDIRRSAKWWGPFLLMLIFSYAFSFSVAKKIGWEQVSENQMKMAPESRQQQFENMPPDQKARAMQMNVNISKGIAFAFPLFALIWSFIVALVLMATFNFGLGAEVGWWKSVAIVQYAGLPTLIRGVLAIGVIWSGAKDPADFMIQNSFGSNLGYYLNYAETPKWLYSIASSVDAFMIWTLVLTAIGFSIVGKKSRGTSYAVVFGWFAVFVLGSAALSAIFS
jgi:hypothetical protein